MYILRKDPKGKWLLIDKDSGDVKGTFASREKAVIQQKVLTGVEKGINSKSKPKEKGFSDKAIEAVEKEL